MSGKTIGHVTELTGSAEIRTPDGLIKLVAMGDSVADGDLLITASATHVQIDFISGKKLEVGEDTEILFDETVFRAESFADADVMADVLALQQALLEGVDDLADLEATAAGPEQVGSSANLSQTPLYARDGREGNVDSRQEFIAPGATDPIDGDREDPDAVSTTTSAGDSDTTGGGSGTPPVAASTGSAALISGTFGGAAAEGNIGDAPVTATGTISISDADPGDNPTFPDVGASASDNGFGSFELVAGVWTYTLDQSAVQNLDAGDVVNDTITFGASDGSSQQITITVTGTDDAPVIAGAFSGSVNEGNVGDAPVTATGGLSISDVDADDSPSFSDVASTSGDNAFGSFELVTGVWTYTLDQSAVQGLDAGDVVNDTITFTASDGSTQQITVNISGTDDSSVISGSFLGAVTEGNVGDAPVTTTGTLLISDPDVDDSPTFADVASTAGDNAFGSFELVAGVWTYTLDQSAVQDLDAGDLVNDTITFATSDGTTQQVTVNITGTDDASVISGTFTGAVVEGDVSDTATATGALLISDVDADDSPSFADVASTGGDNGLGSFELVAGVWTYTLDQSAVQDLDAGDLVNDTITFTASDGSTQQVTVNITGTDDASVITGTFTGAVVEGDVGDTATATGALAISDVDADDSPIFADVASTGGDNGFGSFELVAGVWTYTLDQSAVQDLDAGDVVNDTITFTASDGSTQQVTVNITGTDDASVVSGTFTGAVAEGDIGDTATATGSLSISDVDADDSPSFADVASTGGDNGFGSFELVAGVWTYTLDQSAVQDLDAGDVVNDTITFTASDGSTQQLTVNITGTDDASVITGTFTGAVAEGDVGDTATATGALAISDVDADDSPSFADVASTGGDNGFGSFELVAGVWTYMLDQSAVQDLDAGDVVNDTITFTASDGSTQQVTVNITGTDDVSVISGTFTGAVVEGDVGDTATATGALSISDVDADDSPIFADVASTGGDNGFGSFELVAGVWTYTLDQSAVQDLDAGDVINDTITFTASDGSTQQVTVNITGTDDASVITGTFTGAVAEGDVGDTATATGSLSISDVDADDSPSFADVVSTGGDNGFGSFELVAGVWTYTLNQSAVQDLDAGDVVNDTITFTASDGSTQQVTVNITGTDDASVISGTFTGAVAEGDIGDTATASGSLSISDVDADDSPTFADVTSTGGDNGFGSFELVAGVWTYTLDQSAVQDLDAGDVVNDTITFTASDGSTQQVTVSITGTNDAPIAQNSTVVTTEDIQKVFTSADFGFSDPEGDPMSSITIGTLESVGSLRLNGVNVVQGQTITKAQLDAGELTFDALPDTSGSAYDSFTFTVNDTGTGTVAATMNVDVTPVNDGPLGPVTDIDSAGNKVSVIASVGTQIGITANATDPDPEDIVTYSLDDDAGGRFVIDANTGVVTVASALGATGSVDIIVRATSTDGSPDTTTTLTIDVVNAADDFAVVHESALVDGSGRAETVFDDNDEVGQNIAAGEPTNIATGNLLSNDGTATSITSIDGNAPVGGVITVAGTFGTLVVDAATGDYTYTLTTAADNSAAADDLGVNESFTYQTNVGTSADLNVSIIDDTPQTGDFVTNVPEGQMDEYHLVFTLDVSGSMTGAQFDGLVYLEDGSSTTRLQMAKDALKALAEEYYEQSDTVSVHLVTFSSNAQVLNGGVAYTDLASNLAAIDAMNGSGGTNYEDGLDKTIDALDADGDNVLDITGTNLQTITYFISDGVATVGNTTDPVGATGFDTFVNTHGVDSYAVGIGAGISDFGNLNAIHNVDADGSGTVDNALYVPDVNTLEEDLLSTVPASFAGSVVLSGAVETVNFGADGGFIQSISVTLDTDADDIPDTEVTFAYDPTTGVISNDGGFANISSNILALNDTFGFVEGKLIFDFDTGGYNYFQSSLVSEGDTFTLNFVASDNDGDVTSPTAVTINIVDGKPVANDDTDTLFALDTQQEGNVLSGFSTDGGVSHSTSFSTFSSQGAGVDNTVDNATVTSIEYRGDTIDLTTDTGGLVNAVASGDGSSYSYTVDASGVLALKNTTDFTSLTFNTAGYYLYTPANPPSPPTGAQVRQDYESNATSEINEGITKGISLSSPDGNITYDSSGSVRGVGIGGSRINTGERLIMTFEAALYPHGVQGLQLGANSLGGSNEVFNVTAYHIDGHEMGQAVMTSSGFHTLFSNLSGIGSIKVQAGSNTFATIRAVIFDPVLPDNAAAAVTPEEIGYTITDDDGDTDSATLTLKTISNSFVDLDGDNVETGTAANDFLSGLDGNDILTGGAGHDILEGGAGDDALSGESGDDVLVGGDGADLLLGGTGNDDLVGDAGDDDLQGGTGDDSLSGGDGDDSLLGEAGSDILEGGAGNDTLDGGIDNDFLSAGSGDDTLLGGAGIDFLFGGTGDDTMTGGTGSDTFAWGENDKGSTIDPDADVITDFTVGPGGDVLDLADLLQNEEGNPLTDYLSIEFGDFDGDLDSESRINIDADGGIFFQPTGSVTLENVDLTQGGTLTDQQILDNLLSNGNLNVDT